MNTFMLPNILFNIVIFHFIYVSETTRYVITNPCNIYTSRCVNHFYESTETNVSFFAQHNFTFENEWKSIGKIFYCKNGTCHADYTVKIEKSTQIEYGNEKSSTRSSTVGNSGSISGTITAGVSAGFSAMGVQIGGSIETSVQSGSARSFAVTHQKGNAVSYSTSTANTVGVEEKITCDGVQNEKIFIEARTNMTRMTGNFCEYVDSFLNFNNHDVHIFNCTWVNLRMYPVRNRNIVTDLQCNREIMNF